MKALLVGMVFAGTVGIVEGRARADVQREPDPHFTVAVEPIYLAIGLVEANLEVKLGPHVAVQGVAGYGMFMFATMKELGAEANFYLRPEITGLHVGTEIKYLNGSTHSLPFVGDKMDESDVTERQLGVYAGWKWVGWRNLTAVLQMGVAKLDISGTTSPNDETPKHQVVPTGNLVVGYSF